MVSIGVAGYWSSRLSDEGPGCERGDDLQLSEPMNVMAINRPKTTSVIRSTGSSTRCQVPFPALSFVSFPVGERGSSSLVRAIE